MMLGTPGHIPRERKESERLVPMSRTRRKQQIVLTLVMAIIIPVATFALMGASLKVILIAIAATLAYATFALMSFHSSRWRDIDKDLLTKEQVLSLNPEDQKRYHKAHPETPKPPEPPKPFRI